ncbi:MAG: phosphatase PAP2 family protein [Deltaproteobacteria bacterium]|nr:phosphatase PAP2 family protein [Deltaproteobacteria bacterium]
MRAVVSAVLAVLFAIAPLTARAEEGILDRLDAAGTRLYGDYKAFYLDNGTYLRLGGSLAVGGALANTGADAGVRDFYQENIRNSATDVLSDITRLPGEALLTIPALAVYYLSSESVWAERSLRALLVGGPLGLFLRSATGGGRPTEGGSDWRPFSNNNGLSGHSFIGAAPFITAAKMEERACVRWLLYGASTLPALSRINDDEHYLSQAALGWYLAYLSASAVEKGTATALSIAPYKDGVFVSLALDF